MLDLVVHASSTNPKLSVILDWSNMVTLKETNMIIFYFHLLILNALANWLMLLLFFLKLFHIIVT